MQHGHRGLKPISTEVVKVENVILDVEFVERKLRLRGFKLLSRELQMETTRKR